MMMEEARERAEWRRMAILASVIENSNAFRSGQPATPDKYDPYAIANRKSATDDKQKIRLPFESLRLIMAPRTLPKPKKK